MASSRLSRRALLAGLGAAGVAVSPLGTGMAAAATGTGSAATGGTIPGTTPARTATTAATPPGAPVQLLADESLNYSALDALGAAGYGVTDVGEVLTAVATINAAGPSLQTYTDTFLAWGHRLFELSQQARARDRVSSGEYALRAAASYAQALFYVLGTDAPGREQAVFLAGRRMWDRWTQSIRPVAERMDVSYGQTSLPVWFFRPDTDHRPRPTLILTNGSDGQSVDMWAYGVAAALDRGWNAVVYEGPGQGEPLFVHDIPFTPRWEDVVSPIVDRLWRRRDVDRRRIALFGLSMGGALVARVAAVEHRLAALVCAPAVVSPWAAFPAAFRSVITADKAKTNQVWNTDVVPELPPAVRFLLAKRYEPFGAAVVDAVRSGQLPTDIWTPSQLLQALDVTSVAEQIRCPTLVLDYDDEQFYPGQPKQFAALLKSSATYRLLTEAEGAQLHCSPMAPRVHNEVVFSWLEGTLNA